MGDVTERSSAPGMATALPVRSVDLAGWLRQAEIELAEQAGLAAPTPVAGADRAPSLRDVDAAARAVGVTTAEMVLWTVRGRTEAFAMIDAARLSADRSVRLLPARRWARTQHGIGVLDAAELVEIAAACGLSVPRLWRHLADADVLLADAAPPPRPCRADTAGDELWAGIGAQLREARRTHAMTDQQVCAALPALDVHALGRWERGRDVEHMPLSTYLDLCVLLRVGAAHLLDHAAVTRALSWWPINAQDTATTAPSAATLRRWTRHSAARATADGAVTVHIAALPTLACCLRVPAVASRERR